MCVYRGTAVCRMSYYYTTPHMACFNISFMREFHFPIQAAVSRINTTLDRSLKHYRCLQVFCHDQPALKQTWTGNRVKVGFPEVKHFYFLYAESWKHADHSRDNYHELHENTSFYWAAQKTNEQHERSSDSDELILLINVWWIRHWIYSYNQWRIQ